MPDTNNIDHPSHYNLGGIEVIDAIDAWRLGFYRANVVKYLVRAPFKGSVIEDLRKARWYLDRLVQRLEAGETVADPDVDAAVTAIRNDNWFNCKCGKEHPIGIRPARIQCSCGTVYELVNDAFVERGPAHNDHFDCECGFKHLGVSDKYAFRCACGRCYERNVLGEWIAVDPYEYDDDPVRMGT